MNPLIVDKISKKFLYWKDSGFIFTKHLIKNLPDNYRFYWLIPEKLMKKSHIKWFLEANKNVELIPYPYSTSIHQNRYEFYGNVIKKYFPYGKDVDVIINNQPEVTANLRVLFINQRRENPIILNFYHWIDCAESRQFGEQLGGYFWRQYDGYLNADINYFHTSYADCLFMNEAYGHIKEIANRLVRYFHPPATVFGKEAIELLPNKKIIIFNHRLNGTTGWKEVLTICKEIYKVRQDFVLWFTDEMNISFKRDCKNGKYPFVHIEKLDDKNYGYLLENSHFGVCNHKGYSTWNMAILDTFINNCFMLVPDYEKDFIYKDMFRNSNQKIFHKGGDNLKRKMIELLDASKVEIQEKYNEVIEQNSELFDLNYFTKFTQGMLNDVFKQIDLRLPKKSPKKYDIVKTFIENSPCYKKEWVNEFWSFHSNSNFQKIRWLLLKEGYSDDTTKSESFYFKIFNQPLDKA